MGEDEGELQAGPLLELLADGVERAVEEGAAQHAATDVSVAGEREARLELLKAGGPVLVADLLGEERGVGPLQDLRTRRRAHVHRVEEADLL